MFARCVVHYRAPRAVRCPYEVLEVPQGVPVDVAKASFKKLALQYHPDMRGGNDEKFLEIQEAFESIKAGGRLPRGTSAYNTPGPDAAAGPSWWEGKRQAEKLDMNDLPEATFLYRHMCVWSEDTGAEAARHLNFALAPGMVIYATPRAGPKFKRCVAVIAQVHPKGGTIAYIVNKEGFMGDEMNGSGLYGGPCGHRRHEVLVHRHTELAKREASTTRTAAGYYFDCEVDPAKRALAGAKSFVLNGFCGWGPGVLERIVKRGAWRVVVAAPDWLHKTPRDEIYGVAMGKPILKV